MYSRSLLLPLAWSVSYLSGVNADCESYGIDFVNNGNSNQSFTSVTEFADVAAVELVNWDTGDEYLCSDIPLQPDDTPETSTCDIEKDQMKSGTWGLILISNNGVDPDSPPFANQRTFYLTVGAQATSTVTPTLTFNLTTTPTITSQTTSFIVNTTTVNNSMTVTVPATISLTRTLKTWTRTAIIYTATATASCTVPPRPQQPDPPCRRWPRLIKVPAGVSINGKRDEELETYASVKKRLADIRARRAADIDARDLAKRTADAPTVTITQTTLTVNQTTGYAKAYITLPPITKTKFTVNTAYIWQTKTMTAKFTKVTTVTPTGIMTACKSRGGHFGNGW
ncbi:unnamed protein product [Aureobasidium pullulans]|nr:unnamed protein product [Aureobasidium pullulans]